MTLAERITDVAAAVKGDATSERLRAELHLVKAKYQQSLELIDAAERRADALIGMQSEPTLRAFEAAESASKRKAASRATAIVLLSDWHVEETVDPKTVNGLNEFCLAIAEKRIKRTFEKIPYLLDFARSVAKIDELVLWVGGDVISGYLHEELEEGNSLSPTEATLFAQDMLLSGIDYLLKQAKVSRITIPTSYGNHGRTTRKPRFATGYKNSYEWLLYTQLAARLSKEKRVTWQIARGYHNYLDVQGYTVRFHHGDSVHYQGGVGGVTIPLRKAIAQWNKSRPAQLDCFGHWHQFLDLWDAVGNGCLIGTNAYAIRIKAECQPPTQSFVVIDREYGKTMAVPIFCEAK